MRIIDAARLKASPSTPVCTCVSGGSGLGPGQRVVWRDL